MNKFKTHHARFAGAPRPHRQRGVVLLFALIAVTIMLIGAVALISSFNSSLVSAGNLGIKRDLTNQAEQAVSAVMLKFAGASTLSTTAARGSNKPADNYSATVLPTNSQGIPLDLLKKDSDFAAIWTGADVANTSAISQKVKVRYLVDRLCTAAGDATLTLDPEQCIRGGKEDLYGCDETCLRGSAAKAGAGQPAAVPIPATYRITMRGIGPRNAEAFYQVTFTEPLPPPAVIPP